MRTDDRPPKEQTVTTTRTRYLLALGLAVATLLFLVLAVGALGIIGEGGRADRGYTAVLAVAVLGSAAARFRPRGMALALAATALTQVLVTAVALATGQHHTAGASVVDILGINAMYAALFTMSAWLFRRSAQPVVPTPAG
jgi:hypothetical protein